MYPWLYQSSSLVPQQWLQNHTEFRMGAWFKAALHQGCPSVWNPGLWCPAEVSNTTETPLFYGVLAIETLIYTKKRLPSYILYIILFVGFFFPSFLVDLNIFYFQISPTASSLFTKRQRRKATQTNQTVSVKSMAVLLPSSFLTILGWEMQVLGLPGWSRLFSSYGKIAR